VSINDPSFPPGYQPDPTGLETAIVSTDPTLNAENSTSSILCTAHVPRLARTPPNTYGPHGLPVTNLVADARSFLVELRSHIR
jgi:hypothetical protein